MSITGAGSITAANVAAQTDMMNQLNTLTQELSTGQAATTYSGLASQAGLTLSLNAQLAAINGYATMIDDELTAANPLKREISQIIKAVTRAAELTSKLQDFARNPKLGEQGTGKEER